MLRPALGLARAAAFGFVVFTAGLQAAPVAVSTPFINLDNRAINSLGFASGQFLRIGAVSVTPNGSAGTVGVGTHVMPDGSLLTRDIFFSPSPIIPNFYSRLLTDSPERRGDWTLSFANGPDSTSRVVTLDPGAQHVPFVNSITLSGSGANPTFSWTPPPGVRVDRYRINIYDKARIAAGLGGQVTNRDVLPTQTSYTVQDADFTVPGFAFTFDKDYAIEISVIQTKDGSANSSNDNLQAIARTYADFRRVQDGGPVVNLPVVLTNGSYQFDITVQPGQVYYIDPEVAVGYDYAIGAGNPLFQSVVLPNVGDGLFDIFGFDAGGIPFVLAEDLAAGVTFDFGSNGIDRFRVLGIETSAGLDPLSTTAFITGLTFTGPGQFSGTQTPITVTIDVPEPPVLALAALGLLGLRRWRPVAS